MVVLSVQNALLLIGAWLVYHLIKALYNVSPLHPLQHIPGPKFAAASYLPEFYYDVIKYGRYTKEIQKMHEQYGPIVRINPDELHCSDVSFADEIYAVSGRKRDKPVHQINGSALGEAGFGTVDHDVHRLRRGPVAKFFSRSMIARLEGDVHTLAQKLCDKLLTEVDGKPFDITMAYSCFTTDTITGYCFGESFGLLDQTGWSLNFREPTAALLQPVFIFRFFPWTKLAAPLGVLLVNYLPASIALFIRTLKIDLPARIKETKLALNAGNFSNEDKHPTIFASLLQSELTASDKTPIRLADEAAAVVGAGTETTSWAMTVITYHLLTKPHLLSRLTTELQSQIPDLDPRHLPPWTTLESLPYLGAVIQEGLRLSYGVSARTARVATEEDLVYEGEFNKRSITYTIPRGYAIGMSAGITHHNEEVFHDSYAFVPERWLIETAPGSGAYGRNKEVEKGMFAFSKGSRGCLGMNLALCELQISISALALRVWPRMKLYQTTEKDIAYDHDMFIPMPDSASPGVRVSIV